MKVSVIVPVYNVAPYSRACMDSLLIGQGENCEVIAVNDCSSDESREILREYEKRVANLKVVDFERNQGVSAARNAGLEEAHGEWIMFCDSDDVLLPGALPYLQRKVQEVDCDVVTFELARVKSVDDSVSERMPFRAVVHDMADNNVAAAFVQKNFPHRLWAWNKCFKRELVGNLRFQNFQPCEDAIWVFECMCRARKILELPNVLYKYLQHEGSCLTTVNYKRLYGDIQGMQGLCDAVLTAPFFKQIRSCAYRELRDVFLFCIPYNLAKLSSHDEREELAGLYFQAAKHVFVDSHLGSCCSRIFYKILFRANSLQLLKKYLVWRNSAKRIYARCIRFVGKE